MEQEPMALNHFLQGFGIVVGVTAGVIAGTLVTVVIKYIEKWKNHKQRRESLKFEFEFDIKRIKSFKAELNDYRDAVNGDALKTYHGYIALSKLIYPTAQSMFSDGSLYKLFDDTDDLAKLQKALSRYTIEMELDFDAKIKNNTEICGTEKWVKDKPEIVAHIRYWDKCFQEDIATLEAFYKKLG